MLSPARLGTGTGTGTLPVPPLPHRTHQADAPDAGVDPRAHRGVSGLLAEEEVEFVIVPLAAVGDELGADEGRVCKGTGWRRQPGGTPSPLPILQSHRRGGVGTAVIGWGGPRWMVGSLPLPSISPCPAGADSSPSPLPAPAAPRPSRTVPSALLCLLSCCPGAGGAPRGQEERSGSLTAGDTVERSALRKPTQQAPKETALLGAPTTMQSPRRVCRHAPCR